MNLRLFGHVSFWVGMVVMCWDFFETVLDAGDTPYRLHHYYYGMALALVGYFIFTRRDWLKLYRLLKSFI
jgi:hypothetical protein